MCDNKPRHKSTREDENAADICRPSPPLTLMTSYSAGLPQLSRPCEADTVHSLHFLPYFLNLVLYFHRLFFVFCCVCCSEFWLTLFCICCSTHLPHFLKSSFVSTVPHISLETLHSKAMMITLYCLCQSINSCYTHFVKLSIHNSTLHSVHGSRFTVSAIKSLKVE